MKGLTIRVQESELMSDSIRVLGAVPSRWLTGKFIPVFRPGKSTERK